MSNRILSQLLVMLALTALTAASATAAVYQQCKIQYHIGMMSDDPDFTDTAPSRKEVTVCVRNLEDCNNRSVELVRDYEREYGAVSASERPNLNSIMISGTILEGECSTLD